VDRQHHHGPLQSFETKHVSVEHVLVVEEGVPVSPPAPALLRRWEHALEDVALWKFNPCVVHGDLHEDNLLIHDGSVGSVTGWTDLRIGDPADDFAWLVAVHEQSFA